MGRGRSSSIVARANLVNVGLGVVGATNWFVFTILPGAFLFLALHKVLAQGHGEPPTPFLNALT